jgi:tetratricopeptide (TPR) repeat protein
VGKIMRAKIISLILCLSIVISPSLAISYQTNNPDPEFLGDFMVFNFLDSQFNLKESEKYQKALSDIPEKLKGLTKVWTLVYLSWVFSHLVNEKYGEQFTDKMLDAANKKWDKAGELSGEYLEVFNFWFPKLNSVGKKSIGKTFKGKEVPIEVFIAWAFLFQDSSSPFFQQTEPDIKNMLDFSIALVFAEAKEASMMFMTNVVEIGGPLDSKEGKDSQYFNDKDPTQSTPPQASQKDSTDFSIEDAQDLVRQRPSDPNAHFKLGRAYFLSRQYQEAINPFKETIRINPDHALAHYALGASYLHLGQNQESIISYKKAIQINPNDALAHQELGYAYSKIGQYQKAISSIKETIRLKPNSAKAYFSLGEAYIDNDQLQEAIFSLKEGLRLQPDDYGGHIDLGFAYNKLRRYEEASDSFNEAIRIKPKNSLAHFNLGVAYNKLGRRKESILEYREALRIDPENTSARKNLNILEKKVASERALLEKKLKELDTFNIPEEDNKELPTRQNSTTLSSLDKDLKGGLDAYNRKDYIIAFNKLKPLAERGNSTAQSMLGTLYYEGTGVIQNYGESFRWRKLAAEQGEPTAQAALGALYYMGRGVSKNNIQAHKWFTLAANNGSENGQKGLNVLKREMTLDQIIEAKKLTKNSSKESYDIFKVIRSGLIVTTRKTKDDQWESKISNFVPLVPENSCYGWFVKLNTQLSSVRVKEVFTMPFIPKNINLPDQYSIGSDGRTITGQSNKKIKDNHINNSWCVAEGDPSGNYNFEIFIEGKFIKHFPFTVGREIAPSFSSQSENNKISEKNSNNDLQKYSEYLTLAGNLYSQFIEILTRSSEIDKLSESFLDENITSEYAINQKNILSAKTELKMNSFNKNIVEFAPINFSTPSISRIAKDFNAYLNTLPMLAKKSADLSYKMFDAAIDQNLELYNEIDIRSRETYVSLLEGENNLLNLQKINLQSNSPGFKFYSVVQHSNNSLINVTKARLSEFSADSPLNELDYLAGEPQAYMRIAEIELTKGRDIVNSSNLVINNWISKQRDAFSKFPQYIKTFELIGQSLTKSFEVENNIIDVIQALISEYPNIESLDKVEILLGEFMDQRTSLQQERASLLSKFKN